ncbi:MAG: hypothetical protein K1X68_07520 [Saprospiraceae bacterium]|nr:hypothetical protein [Saprospiraceae bacterium]HMW38863.1 hypothetical protein [Saprospiraceae bacterium]HMX87856.1 hypothetical protein [Saprospiraceae bacterium]HMZ39704.1 hypothetical protein [Saprospiraceae bacterium]HNA64275.1 hypothetical protein [Saprospiraceae bacterium]
MKNFFAMVLISCTLVYGCTSKNRFEKSSDGNTKETYNPTPTSGPNPTKDQIKGSITDVESDAIPFLKIDADTPRWSMNMGLIQEGIFDVKLNMSSENKIYFGLLKKVQQPNHSGIFYVGELNSNSGKQVIQLYVERLPCTDNQQKQHNARVTLLKDNKEFYACGDFQN